MLRSTEDSTLVRFKLASRKTKYVAQGIESMRGNKFKIDFPRLSTSNSEANPGSADDDLVRQPTQDNFIWWITLATPQRHYLFPKDVFTLFTWHFHIDHLAASRNVWGSWVSHFSITSSFWTRFGSP
ncbi:hypothetical protein ACOMHN_066321 [Nucella lapillus]